MDHAFGVKIQCLALDPEGWFSKSFLILSFICISFWLLVSILVKECVLSEVGGILPLLLPAQMYTSQPPSEDWLKVAYELVENAHETAI